MPPGRLELFFALFIPASCREEVLGDLAEKYTSPAQYIIFAIRTVPFVIYSRMRRDNRLVFLLTDPVLIYSAFVFEVWYGGALPHPDAAAFEHLVLPAALTWLYLLVRAVLVEWPAFEPTLWAILSFMVAFMSGAVHPAWLNGFFSAWILVSATRRLSPPPISHKVFAVGVTAWVLLHFPGWFWWTGAGIFVLLTGHFLITRFAAKSGCRPDPL